MALDFSKLQTEVTAQGGIITSVQAEVAALQAGTTSSAEQATVDALTAQVTTNNAALSALVPPVTTPSS